MTTASEKRASVAIASDPGQALHLAPNFQPDVDLVTSEGLIAFGVKGSGKSNFVALTAEQLGRFFLPQIVLDTEREYQSLVNTLPHAVIATANRCPSAYDILHRGLQVVIDLQSWETDEAAALAIVALVNELFAVTNAQAPQDRVPCAIHLDEASYWLPQDAVTYLSKETRKALADAFHKLASRGRKQGLTPFLYTQSISEIAKPAIRQAGIKVLMRQTLDIDLNRYCEYIAGATEQTRKAIQRFGKGQAVVILPDGTQRKTQLNERQSIHTSHTPSSQAALRKFAALALDIDALPMRDLTTATGSPQETPRAKSAERQAQRSTAPAQPGKAKHAPAIRDRVFTLLEEDPARTPRQLAAIIGCPTNTAQIYKREFTTRSEQPQRNSIMVTKVRALLDENPAYTPSQIAHRTRYSSRNVKDILARIQASNASLPATPQNQK